MSDVNKESIIQKIKHCLALSKSSNENEVATALKMARSLMQKHQVTENDVHLLEIKEALMKTNTRVKPPRWENRLASLVSGVFDCRLIHTSRIDPKNGKNVGYWKFIGLEPSPEIANYAMKVLMRQLKNSREKYIDEVLSMEKLRSTQIERADLFCEGWVMGAEIAIGEFKITPETKAMTDRYLEAKGVKLGKLEVRARTEDFNDLSTKQMNDLLKGHENGKEARLHNAVDNNRTVLEGVGYDG